MPREGPGAEGWVLLPSFSHPPCWALCKSRSTCGRFVQHRHPVPCPHVLQELWVPLWGSWGRVSCTAWPGSQLGTGLTTLRDAAIPWGLLLGHELGHSSGKENCSSRRPSTKGASRGNPGPGGRSQEPDPSGVPGRALLCQGAGCERDPGMQPSGEASCPPACPPARRPVNSRFFFACI